MKTPDVRLAELGDLFKQRNAMYSNTYHRQGEIVIAVFDGSIPEITSGIDASRIAIINTILSKMSRYAANFSNGGHADSLDDISVYCQMLRELDDIKKERQDDIRRF